MMEDRPDHFIDPIKVAIELRRGGKTIAYREFNSREVTIGRSSTSTIILDDGRVSRDHARIDQDHRGSCSLVNLSPHSGTYLDGRRLAPGESARLANRHVIRIVDHELVFHRPEFALSDGSSEQFLPEIAWRLFVPGSSDSRLSRAGEVPQSSGRLLDVARIMGLATELDTMLDHAIGDVLARFPNAAGGVVLVPGPGGDNNLQLAVGSFRPREVAGDRLVSSAGLARRSFERVEAMLFVERPREIYFADEGFIDGPIRAWLSVPLLGMDAQPVGLIQIYSRAFEPNFTAASLQRSDSRSAGNVDFSQGLPFSPEDLARLTCFTLVLGLAIEFHGLERSDASEACRAIQAALFPSESPRIPGYFILGNSLPARTFSGRFHDFVPRGAHGRSGDSPRWVAVAGATADNRLRSALVMADLCLEIRRLVHAAVEIQEIASRVNRMIHAAGAEPAGMDLLLAEIDPGEHRVSLVCAGHCAARLDCNSDRTSTAELGPAICGPPLGVEPDVAYRMASVVIEPGEVVKLRVDRPNAVNPDDPWSLHDEAQVWISRERPPG
jgi:hypothetical protein